MGRQRGDFLLQLDFLIGGGNFKYWLLRLNIKEENMSVYNPELHLWTIDNWSAYGAVPSGSSFSIWVSPKFLEVAKKIQYDEKIAQVRAREIVKTAGFKHVSDTESFLRFGEFGLMSFCVPGNACDLSLEYDERRVMERGASFRPHNVDHPIQQSALMAIWLMWANYVEGEIYKRKKEENK